MGHIEVNPELEITTPRVDSVFESQFREPPIWLEHEAGKARFRITSPPDGLDVAVLIMPGYGESSVHLKGLHEEYWNQGWTTASLHHRANHHKQSSLEGESPYQHARALSVVKVAEYLHDFFDENITLIAQARSEGGVSVPLAANDHPDLFDAIILDHAAAAHGQRDFSDIPIAAMSEAIDFVGRSATVKNDFRSEVRELVSMFGYRDIGRSAVRRVVEDVHSTDLLWAVNPVLRAQSWLAREIGLTDKLPNGRTKDFLLRHSSAPVPISFIREQIGRVGELFEADNAELLAKLQATYGIEIMGIYGDHDWLFPAASVDELIKATMSDEYIELNTRHLDMSVRQKVVGNAAQELIHRLLAANN